ncbi:MAG: hypothetical protein V2A66_07320 [Pseudomonadota bacterium]
MIWYIISIIALIAALALLVTTRLRDRRYERMKTSEAMGEQVRAEIEEERRGLEERHEKFRAALRQAGSKGT